ncbi:hypothetical protein AX17_003101 [Amanita inopinata Kibby_2008]|nr:hypothetical protein AX17_003101 [Amanita inopinata Kibby_2008]
MEDGSYDVFDVEYISHLVDQLNSILRSLHINLSIPIESPTDLTPSLLIAILESLLGTRIPLDEYSVTPQGNRPGAVEGINRIQNMKIFLGILELDVLGIDAGLSDIDPRRLARGEWDEVLYVAEILCWIGRQVDLVDDSPPTPTNNGIESAIRDTIEYVIDAGTSRSDMGLGIYVPQDEKIPSRSPSMLSNDLASDIELTANFVPARAPSTCCSECGAEIQEYTKATPLLFTTNQMEHLGQLSRQDHNWSP